MTAPTVFLRGTRWYMSERTRSGFRHTDIGPVTSIHTKAKAEERAVELIGRRAA